MKNKILTGLLAMLGFSACDPFGTPDMYGVPVPEYGAPYADFTVKGKVADETGAPLKGIRVVLKPYAENDHYNDTVATGASGGYELRKEWWDLFVDFKVQVIAEDVDGEANGGVFVKKAAEVPFAKSDFTGGDSWYKGSAEKTVDITLKKAEGDEE